MATYDITVSKPTSLAPGDILNCPYTRLQQYMDLPKGKYKLECWGAAGNRSYSIYPGYSTGTITLSSPTTLYLYVGGKPIQQYGSYYEGGWNGGGSSYGSGSDSGSGGGATDICLVSSEVTADAYGRYLRTDASYKSRLIVAGGSGGGYSSSSEYYNYRSGGWCPASGNTTGSNYQGGMTAAGGMGVSSYMVAGGFGYGVTSTYSGDDYAGGGGGWYGGGSQGDAYSGGGSSFVWCDTYASYVPSGYTPTADLKMTDVTIQYGNTSIVLPSGTSSVGNSDNGYARITVIEVSSIDIPVNIGGTWKSTDSAYVNIDGTWKTIDSVYTNINGTWKSQ